MARTTKFIHAADVHLDSPLDQLRKLDSTTASQLQQACRRSLERIIETAIQHRVSAVLIAGDLFDWPVKDASAGLWVDSQFKRLQRESIPVVLIRGNHDAQSNARKVVHWSEGVHSFGSSSAETLILDSCGLAIHGQSFEARAETNDLASGYPNPVSGYFNIGMLHTSLAGSSAHDVYAPTTVSFLESKGYDYWALGHIHQRSARSLSSRCYIGFSGNTQGRHIRESGPRGFNLVHLSNGQLDRVEFIASDSLRWHEVDLDLSQLALLGEIEDMLPESISPLVEAAEDRMLAIRLRLTGSTSLHRELTMIHTVDKLVDTLSARLAELGPVWLEKIKVSTQPSSNLDMADLDLPLRYLQQITDELQHDPGLRQQVSVTLEEMLKKCRLDLLPLRSPLVSDSFQDDALPELLKSAHDLVLSRLSSESE